MKMMKITELRLKEYLLEYYKIENKTPEINETIDELKGILYKGGSIKC